MNRLVSITLGVVIVIGVLGSLAAMQPEAPSKTDFPQLEGKGVWLERKGYKAIVRGDLRVETVGSHSFIIVSNEWDDLKWEEWWRLEDIQSIKVFPTLKEAQTYQTRLEEHRRKQAEARERGRLLSE